MTQSKKNSPDNLFTTAFWVILAFVLAGIILILISSNIPSEGDTEYIHEFLKEIGIVLIAVFGVSLIYEHTLASKYFAYFLNRLSEQIERGESNAAICEYLGIIKIYPSRDVFEQKLPLSFIVSSMASDSRLRIVARTLFMVMTKPDIIRVALDQGGTVELCLTNPKISQDQLSKMSDIQVEDIKSAVSSFKKDIVNWLKTTRPPGSIEVRYHDIPSQDSFTLWQTPSGSQIAWDLSFGRAITAKRILLMNPDKPLGMDLDARYSMTWNGARSVFRYSSERIRLNKL